MGFSFLRIKKAILILIYMRLWLQSWCFSTLFMAVHTTIGAIDLWRLWMACISALLKLYPLVGELCLRQFYIQNNYFLYWVKNHLSEHTHLTFYILIFLHYIRKKASYGRQSKSHSRLVFTKDVLLEQRYYLYILS